MNSTFGTIEDTQKVRRPCSQRRPADNVHIRFEDAYGHRGNHEDLYYLSPWEFTAHWKLEYLKAPSAYSKDPKTKWTAAGLTYREMLKEDKTACAPKPGEHYVVINSDDCHRYISYPENQKTEFLRHVAVMVRRKRPHVPVPSNTPLPTDSKTAEEQGRMYSAYLRPWVLEKTYASPHVPHLSDIDILVSDAVKAHAFWNSEIDAQ